MAWHTVSKDGTIEIDGSVFHEVYPNNPTRTFPVGAYVWIPDTDHTAEIQVFAQRYDGKIGPYIANGRSGEAH